MAVRAADGGEERVARLNLSGASCSRTCGSRLVFTLRETIVQRMELHLGVVLRSMRGATHSETARNKIRLRRFSQGKLPRSLYGRESPFTCMEAEIACFWSGAPGYSRPKRKL
jgi:hypothetical protein